MYFDGANAGKQRVIMNIFLISVRLVDVSIPWDALVDPGTSRGLQTVESLVPVDIMAFTAGFWRRRGVSFTLMPTLVGVVGVSGVP